MNFRQRNNDFERKTGHGKIIVGSFLVVLFIIFFSFQGTRNFLFGVGAPFWGVKNSIETFFSDNIGLLQSKAALISENNTLKAEIQKDQENSLLSAALKDENTDLKNILGRKSDSQKEILATILAKPFFSPYDTLVIDLGTADGIAVGDQVLVDGDIYIGFVNEIYSHSSKVVLYSSSGETVNVFVGSSTIEKTATGMGGGNFSLEMPVGSSVNVGDPIVIPSVSANIFSTVEKIESEPTDSFETVLFKNPANISELQYVEVLPGNKGKNS